MARKIVFTSGKGGTGKTTVAANIGIRLAKKGERVILCDADFGLNNMDAVTGAEGRAAFDLADVAEGKCRAAQALARHTQYKNLYLLSIAQSAKERSVSAQSLKVVLDSLSPQFDYIFIDSPAGIGEGFHRAVAAADEGIVVTTPHPSALRSADKAIALLKSYRLERIYLVVNQVRGDLVLRGEILSPKEIAELLSLPLLAVIPQSDEVYRNIFDDRQKVFKAAAESLAGGKNRLFNVTAPYQSLRGRIRMGIARNL
jgi:septum site-determining protein MinD